MSTMVKLGEREIALSERTLKILLFVVQQQSMIDEIPFGSLRFDLAGRKVQPSLTRSYRPLHEEDSDTE